MSRRMHTTFSAIWDEIAIPFADYCKENSKKMNIILMSLVLKYLKEEDPSIYEKIIFGLKEQKNHKNFELFDNINE